MKRILVVGSEGLIGKEIQRILYSNYNLICLDKQIKRENQETGIIDIECDITDKEELNAAYCKIKENKISIDGIVFAAGVTNKDSFFSLHRNSINEVIDVNVNSIIYVLKRLYDLLSLKVSIVCIASQNGCIGHEDRIIYGPSKAAIIQLVKNLTVDFTKYSNINLKINAISPGYIQDSYNEQFFATYPGKKYLERNPYEKLVKPLEVANIIQFLLSDKSDGIRGQNIAVDYGYTII
ncbi:SDR family oxidoreductase [Lentibacillus sp. CBA3610]|uniref:SDR family oxidoreductase n=1 Tax=Lentibacillus sp. CBA3610 TaxID=2518176 RepID=UPI0015956F68|nr:SDR family oxidoreductase [Lentibacillus sp. CBA3610]QKY71284.1 SDR family oxidoreductase [Lentibacillus sp. CBA3610]